MGLAAFASHRQIDGPVLTRQHWNRSEVGMMLAIMLHAGVLTLVAFRAPEFFTDVFPHFLAAVLQSSVTSKIALCVGSLEFGTAA